MKSIVIIPTYNEIENISNIINAVLAKKDDFHILIVDDQSPDGTALLVKDLMKKHKTIFIEEALHRLVEIYFMTYKMTF